MEILTFNRRILKYTGIIPLNINVTRCLNFLFLSVYIWIFKYLNWNYADLILSSQAIYLFFITTAVVSDYINFYNFRNELMHIIHFTESLVDRCKTKKKKKKTI